MNICDHAYKNGQEISKSDTCQKEQSYMSGNLDEIAYKVVDHSWQCAKFCEPFKTVAPGDGFLSHWYYDGGCYCLSPDQVTGTEGWSGSIGGLANCMPGIYMSHAE
jgi:hypothetical protein